MNCHNLNYKGNNSLIFPVLGRLCVLNQIINTHNGKEQKSTSRSVRSDMCIVKNQNKSYGQMLCCGASNIPMKSLNSWCCVF